MAFLPYIQHCSWFGIVAGKEKWLSILLITDSYENTHDEVRCQRETSFAASRGAAVIFWTF